MFTPANEPHALALAHGTRPPLVTPRHPRRWYQRERTIGLGSITAEDMRKMNYAVDGEKKDATVVAEEFLTSHHLAAPSEVAISHQYPV